MQRSMGAAVGVDTETFADREFLKRLQSRLQGARLLGHMPFDVLILDKNGQPIGLPVRIGTDGASVSSQADTSASMEDTVEDIPTSIAEKCETTGTDDAIIEALEEAESPMPRKNIARRAKCNNNSYFYSRLIHLCTIGILRRYPGHLYWLAARGAAPCN